MDAQVSKTPQKISEELLHSEGAFTRIRLESDTCALASG